MPQQCHDETDTRLYIAADERSLHFAWIGCLDAVAVANVDGSVSSKSTYYFRMEIWCYVDYEVLPVNQK